MSSVVSVVVPIYNVEPYLRSCLDSILTQARACTLDVVLVEDGSTDGSAAIAEEYVDRHPYMRLIRKRNGGLGPARNVGAAQARGDYLIFLDSDDVLPDGTYAEMASALDNSPVDFVTGNVVRLKGKNTPISAAHQNSHPADLPSTHISEHRGLLWDTTAWNKMFRRQFWEGHGLVHPEGVLYEDMELMTRSHLLAKRVAVLKRTCYLWRIRTEWPPSITQCRTDLQNIDDRFTAIFALFETLQRYGTPELRENYEHKILSMDMPIYVRHYGRNDSQRYRDRLEGHVRRALQLCVTNALGRVSSVDRLKYWLIANDRADEVAGINRSQDTHFDMCPLTVHDRRVARTYPTLDPTRGEVPAALVDVTSELSPHTTVYDVRHQDRVLCMDVHAFVPGISPEASRAMVRRFYLRNTTTGRRIELEAEPWTARVPTAMLRMLHFDGSWSRVSLRVAVDEFIEQIGPEDTSWDVWVDCELAGLVWSDRVRRRDGEYSERDRHVDTTQRRVRACLSRDDRLQVVVEPLSAYSICSGTHVEPGSTLVLHSEHGPVRSWPLDNIGLDDSWAILGTHIAAAMAESGLNKGSLAVRTPSQEHRVTAPWGFEREWDTDDGHMLTIASHADGYATVFRRRQSARIVELSLDAEGVLLVQLDERHKGDYLELVHNDRNCRHAFQPLPGCQAIDLAYVDRWSLDTPIPIGEWRIVARPAPAGDAEHEPTVAARLRDVLPLECRSNGVHASLRVNDAGTLVLRVSTDWPEYADLHAKRRRLETEFYPALLRRPVTPSVLFQSWGGTAFNDGPRRVYEELARRLPNARMTWIAADPSAMIPQDVPTVLRGTKDYYEALAQARYVVSNSGMPEHFEKREGCTYLRLERGIPVKRIGSDVTGVASLAASTLRKVAHDARRWDVLVTGHPEASCIDRRAFGYEGTVFEAGQPRLDALTEPGAGAQRDRIRSRLGISASERLVLYAPTWRDNLFSRPNQYVMPQGLDLGRVLDQLGEGWRLLVKNHPTVADRTGRRLDPRVINAYGYPEMTDLYLAADVLITDYSSAVFDFAVTRKPILIFAPDLEEFSERTRGVYWDMHADLPGPVIRSSDAVVECLHEMPARETQWQTRYDQFHARFCRIEDGRAAERVVEAVFAEWLD
jgi:CDP-glycerol glycerophosphotransferase